MKKSRQIIRDDVYGDIFIPKFAFDLIDTPEFQRLRRIKQLGGSYLVYVGATHTRFQHSIGVMHNLYTIKSENKTHNFSEKKWKTILAAGLLHDVGHGPLSHALEAINEDFCHEKIGYKIILDKKSEINKMLRKNKINPQEVVEMFDEKKNPIAAHLLSSHVDADRMDYLLRDAHNTGTNYGHIDREKLIMSMDLSGKKLTFKSSGISSIESFLYARYQAFKSVYLHRVGLAHQEMFRQLFKRLKLLKNNNEYKPFIKKFEPILGKFSLEGYLKMDDYTLHSLVIDLQQTSDKIIVDLSKRIINRNLFAVWTYENKKQANKLKNKIIKAGFDPKFYYSELKVEKTPYARKNFKSIMIIKRGTKKPINVVELSSLIKTMTKQKHSAKYIVIPKVK